MKTKKEDNSSSRKNIPNNIIKWAHIIGLQILILCVIGIPKRSKYNLHIDMPSPYTIVADRDFLVEDEEATKRKIEEAAEKIDYVYDYSPFWSLNAWEKFKSAFMKLNERSENLNAKYIKNFLRNEGIEINEGDADYLLREKFSPSILKNIEPLISWTKDVYIVADKKLFLKHLEKGVVIRILKKDGSITSEIKLNDIKNIIEINEVKKKLKTKTECPECITIAEKLISPNLYFNESETLKRKVEAEGSVKPVFHSIKKGEVIVRAGDRVTEEIWKKVKAYEGIKKTSYEWKFYLGSSVLNLFMFFIIFYYLPGRIKTYNLSIKDLSFISLFIFLSTAIIKSLSIIGDAISLKFGWEAEPAFGFLLPSPMVPMVVSTLLGLTHAFLIFIIMITIEATILKVQIYPVLFHLLYGLTLLYFLKSKRMRIAVVKAGLESILWILFFATGIGLIAGSSGFFSLIKFNLYGILCGILSGILSTAIIPLAEMLFGYTSELKLIELSYREHPLLKKLAIGAPGSFQHSLMVSDLSEEAAEAIKANSTIAKIGGLYHDIGKIKNPNYFIENQKPGENPHDHLSPKMSALIVISHVRDGRELALKYKLPKEIVEIIESHHGTSVVQYFYDKAKKTWDPQRSELSADDFRYPGPKPKTKEACIVMMADRVEAAVKVLDPITPQKIESAVEEIFRRLFEDGQLDNCDITTHEIALIKEIFVKKLVATYHQRIDYPSTLKQKKAKVLPFSGNDKSFNNNSK
jgi:putative nucleotidyltransferase with HDIG domain